VFVPHAYRHVANLETCGTWCRLEPRVTHSGATTRLLLLLLLQALRALNITAAFSPMAANLSRLSEQPLFITDVLQTVSSNSACSPGYAAASFASAAVAAGHAAAAVSKQQAMAAFNVLPLRLLQQGTEAAAATHQHDDADDHR
jgi:hypothetical protein